MAKRYAKKQYYTSRGSAAAERREKLIKLIAIIVALAVAAVIAFVVFDKEKKEHDAVAKLSERRKLTGLAYYPQRVDIDNRLAAGFVPDDLTYLYTIPEGTGLQLVKEAADAYTNMHNAMAANGLSVVILDAYISYNDQVARYNAQIAMYMADGYSQQIAADKTLKVMELPGADEHQLGYSLDLSTNGKKQSGFLTTDQGEWLQRHAHEYGFIFRYPESKRFVTGVDGEPWHIRYVGKDAATYMVKYDLCLEEYIELAKKESPKAVPQQNYTGDTIVSVEYVSKTDA